MARYASMVIAKAREQTGYLEKKSNAMLDDKTANAGSSNYTKYARDLDAIPGFYNGKKNGYPWCDVYFDWLFVQCFGVEAAKEMLCQPSRSYGAGCEYSANYYKKMGRFYKKNPKPGDQVFFRNYAHTGLVVDVDKTYVYTNEGNTSTKEGVVANGGGVWDKKYKLGDSCIDGYGRPKYDPEPGDNAAAEDEAVKENEGRYIMEMRMLEKGCKGEDVRALQILLIGRGYSCGEAGADGDFGSKTAEAVEKYQGDHALTVDAIVGPATMGSLMGVTK